LISDHPSAPSVVAEGPHTGKTLHQLIEEDPVAVLGNPALLTPNGRFPLLLKILDAEDVLSVQVHPDDLTAKELGEPDVGKTESWYVLYADPGAELICGVRSGTSDTQFEAALKVGKLDELLIHKPVIEGDAVFVSAGIVHAIGGGIVLAEIQQNSDLTYRLHDWNRVDSAGKSRELHIEKGHRATKLDAKPSWREITTSKKSKINSSYFELIFESDFFSVARIEVEGEIDFDTLNHFLIVFCEKGSIIVSNETEKSVLERASSLLIPACINKITLNGEGSILLYATRSFRGEYIE